ncbi:MAG: AAA family ATPase [Planctomycetes bacterium]|nr:AAA family ATPase [Planctomycetota bacterium]
MSDATAIEKVIEMGRIAARPVEPEIMRFTVNLGREESRPTVVEVSDVPAGDVRWLWPGKFPIGKISLVAGDPGRGKSLLALDLAARLSRGRVWPDGQANTLPPSSTLLLTAEDDVGDTVRPRLEALGADVRYVRSMRGLFSEGYYKGFQLPRDLPTLEEAVTETPDARLVVIDPLLAFLTTGTANSNSALRALLATLQEMAERLGFAVIAISHLTKSCGVSPLYRAMGSLALVAASRAVWTLWPDLDEPERTFFIPLKCNLSAALHAHAYRIAASPLNPKQPVVVWEPEPIPMALMATSTAHPVFRAKDHECATWLRDVLKGGPVPSTDLGKAAREEGFGRTVFRRAKNALRVVTYRDGAREMWFCRLPD